MTSSSGPLPESLASESEDVPSQGKSSALAGKVAAVTGAGRGIGRSVALALAASGANVVLTSRTNDELERVAEEIRGCGGEASTLAGNIADTAFVDEYFDFIEESNGRLDTLINNAGAARFASLEEVTPQDLHEMLNVNTVAPYACMRRAIRLMRDGDDEGHVVNIGSVEAFWTSQGGSGAYPASKFALRALTMAIAKELKESGSGIRVSMVNPGGVDTTLVDGPPNPRLLRPEAVARAVMHTVTAPPDVHVFDTMVVAKSSVYW